MDGVVIHAEHVYRETPIVGTALIVVLTVVFLAWIVWNMIECFKQKSNDRWGVAFVLAFATVILGCLNIGMINSSCTILNDLVVTIDDTVCFNEFYEHYEVVSQDGKLYTVRELSIEETEPKEAGDNE